MEKRTTEQGDVWINIISIHEAGSSCNKHRPHVRE